MLLTDYFEAGTEAAAFTLQEFLTASAVSVVLGLAIMFFYSFKNSTASRNFLMTLAILPIVVQTVIMVVNGNVGTGVAVAGAFSLVRFRSVPGNARDICCIVIGDVSRRRLLRYGHSLRMSIF